MVEVLRIKINNTANIEGINFAKFEERSERETHSEKNLRNCVKYISEFATLRQAIKTQIRLKLGHCPNWVGGWLNVDFNVPTVYEIF